jgi:hypothetical protein
VGEANVVMGFGIDTLENVDEALFFRHPTAKATAVPPPLERRTAHKQWIRATPLSVSAF